MPKVSISTKTASIITAKKSQIMAIVGKGVPILSPLANRNAAAERTAGISAPILSPPANRNAVPARAAGTNALILSPPANRNAAAEKVAGISALILSPPANRNAVPKPRKAPSQNSSSTPDALSELRPI